MRCHTHREAEAVGVCKSCGKGLCPDCAVDLERGLACRGRCEADVRALIDLVDRSLAQLDRSAKLLGSARGIYRGLGGFLIVMALVFGGFHFVWDDGGGFLAIVAAAFLVFGVLLLVMTRKLPGHEDGASPDGAR